jgi:flagellar FliL protein
MKNKKLLIPLIALLVLGGVYKFVLAKPKAEAAKAKVDGTVYVLGKEFLINLQDGRFAKLTVALILGHDDPTTAPAGGGHEASTTPTIDGYGAMTQEAVVRAIVTNDLTDARDTDLVDAVGRKAAQDRILKDIRKKTDVHVEEVLFPDVTVQ